MSQSITDRLQEVIGGLGGDEGSEPEPDSGSDEPEGVDRRRQRATADKNLFLKRFDKLAYRLFGEYFSEREEEYADYRRAVNQARMDVVYNIYLSRVALSAVVAAVIGIVSGIALTVVLSSMGYLTGVGTNLRGPGVLESFMSQYSVYIFGAFISFVVMDVLAAVVGGVLYYIPIYKAGERRRRINRMLPSSITFMYALSNGGMNIIEVMEELSKSEDVYGEVSKEFDVMIRDMEYFGSDLRASLENASRMTPSDNLQSFLDDLLSVIDSGGEVTPFLLTKSQQYHEIRKQDQKSFLDTLALMAEAYVTAFVAAPLFIIIITTIMSLMGGANMTQIYLLVYGGLPLASLGFVIVIDLISTGGEQGAETLDLEHDEFDMEQLKQNAEESQDARVEDIVGGRRKVGVKRKLTNPLSSIRENPVLSLIITVPVGLLIAALSILYGFAEPSVDAFLESPITNTTYLWVFPFLTAAIPLSYFHEKKSRREKKILKELPDTIKKIRSANDTGMTLKESILLVSETSSGALAQELEKVYNDVKWRGNLNDSLTSFANRMKVPRLSRTIKLIKKANESSGNIQSVLDIAARDVELEYKLDRERFQNMIIYTVIIILTFLVFLFVIVVLDSRFLSEMTEVASPESGGSSNVGGSSSGSGSGGAFSVSDIPIDTFRMVFFHASIIQAFTTGLIAGQMGENDVLSGLKYCVAMTVIALLVFIFI